MSRTSIHYAESDEQQSTSLATAIPNSGAFDETSFNFTLIHGGDDQEGLIHTEVLMASATFKDGESAGMPVPLHCTWYNISGEQNEFVKIPDVSGSCY